MINLSRDFAQRDEGVKTRLQEVFELKNSKAPFLIFDANYWMFGENPELIPDGYFVNPEAILEYQVRKIKRHYELFSDDSYLGFLMPWSGTTVLASAFGTPVVYQDKADPAVDIPPVHSVEEVKKLRIPNPYKDGQMPYVLRMIDYFKQNCDLVTGVTDCQGPLTTALSIVGYENFIYWMYDYPNVIHELMDIVTEALIQWVKIQKKHAGLPMEKEAYIIGTRIPDGFGGVWIADDDSVILSSELYREFVVPYNSRVLTAFGGGGIHYCGVSNHNIDNFLSTKGLTVINNFTMGDFKKARLLKNALQKKGIAYMACDYIPADEDIPAYYKELFSALDQTGLIVVCYVAPEVALVNGKYKGCRRDASNLASSVKKAVETEINLHSNA